jgi:hypothetical protein
MQKLTPPIKLKKEREDLFRLHCTLDGNADEFSFSMPMKEDGERTLLDDDRYFSLIGDSLVGHWLRAAIGPFERASCGMHLTPDQIAAPVELRVEPQDNSNAFEYKVVLNTDGKISEHKIDIKQEEETYTASWEYGQCTRKLWGDLHFALDRDASPLLTTALRIYRAIQIANSESTPHWGTKAL